MYIAVIADNIADRKQLERLLSRANEAISDETGTLYIDAFGDEKSFLSTAMRYEIFFVDIVSGEDQARNVIEILKNAKRKDVKAEEGVSEKELKSLEEGFKRTDDI